MAINRHSWRYPVPALLAQCKIIHATAQDNPMIYDCSRCAFFALLVLTVLPVDAQQVCIDDTHGSIGGNVEVVSGPFGYASYQFSEPADGEPLALDARNVSFIVANSKNPNPTAAAECNVGSQPVNTYPVKIYGGDLTSLVGGIINSEIPQESDWDFTYCNSAAVIFKNASGNTVDGMRITGAWDGIRPSDNAPNLTVKNNWISNVRDDVIENDKFFPMTFEDNLVDGTFQGISVHSGGGIGAQSQNKVRIDGSVIRIREYLYKGNPKYGALFKNEVVSPKSIITNTVVAVDYKGGITFSSYWQRSWAKIESCSNNLFLWLSDAPIPSAVGMPPACFTVLKGAAARQAWELSKQNWIDCHPKVARAPGDPASNPEQCAANTFGGYSQAADVCNETCH